MLQPEMTEIFRAGGGAALPAELHFAKPGVAFAAQVIDLNASGAVVQPKGFFGNALLTLPGAVGSPLSLSVTAGKDLYRVPCVLARLREPLLLIAYTGPTEVVVRRAQRRAPCEVQALYRAPLSFGASSTWKPAVATDLSLRGLRLRIAGQVKVPGRIELRLTLGEQTVDAMGCARHARITKTGRTIVGVEFDPLEAEVEEWVRGWVNENGTVS